MNLEEKNEIIVEKLRNLINNNPSLYQEIEKEFGNVLPDLFLSKDEKTLNDIVNFLVKPSRQTITTLSDWADWLEDKKNVLCNTGIFEYAEKEKENFVSGFVVCTSSFDSFVEGERYLFEYVGNDTYVGRSDNILNETFYISPRELFTFFRDLHEEVPADEVADEIFDEAGPSDNRTLDEMVYPLTQKPFPKDTWEYVVEFKDKFGRLPKDIDELSCLVDFVEKHKKEEVINYSDKMPTEFTKQVANIVASVLKGEYLYSEGYVKYLAQTLFGYAKNEIKQNIPVPQSIASDKIEALMLRYLQSAVIRTDDSEIISDTKEYARQLTNLIIFEQKPTKEALEYVKEHHSSSELSDFQNAMNIAVAKAYDAGKNSNNKCFVDEETLKQNLSVLYSILPKCVDCQPRIIGDKDCIELQDFLKQLSEQLLQN